MSRQKLKLIVWMLCAFQFAEGRPGKSNVSDEPKQAQISAAYINPDVELVNVAGVVQPDEDAYRRAATANGMDPAIVAEVIRTKKPVVKTEVEASGAKRTTTYKLEADGSISRHTLTEYAPTVQRVHRPVFINTPTRNADSETEKEWEWNPTSVTRVGSPGTEQTFNFPAYTPTWTRPVFQNYPSFGNGPFSPTNKEDGDDSTNVKLPESWNTRQWPRTNTFAHVDPSNSGTVTTTVTNDDGTKVTTTHTVGPTKWTTHTYTYPGTSTFPGTSSFPTFDVQTTTPFPSLEDFLKAHTTTTISSLLPGNTPVTKINIEDLPAVRVTDIQPQDRVPSTVQSTRTYTKTIQTSGIPTAADLDPKMREILGKAGISPDELLRSQNGTITKTRREPDGSTVTTTYRVRTAPSSSDVNGHSNSHALPSFTTTFDLDEPRGPFFIIPTTTETPSHVSSSHSGAIFPVPERPKFDFRLGVRPKVSAEPSVRVVRNRDNAIEEFLAKVGLTPATIEASSGEVVKTIVDDKGRVLTATFVLSTVRGSDEHTDDKDKKPPLK